MHFGRMLLLTAAAVVLAACQARESRAEEPVCAAVFPCDEHGAVLPEFNDPEGPCLDLYLSQCAAIRRELSNESGLVQRVAELELENAKLKEQLKLLKSKLRKKGAR